MIRSSMMCAARVRGRRAVFGSCAGERRRRGIRHPNPRRRRHIEAVVVAWCPRAQRCMHAGATCTMPWRPISKIRYAGTRSAGPRPRMRRSGSCALLSQPSGIERRHRSELSVGVRSAHGTRRTHASCLCLGAELGRNRRTGVGLIWVLPPTQRTHRRKVREMPRRRQRSAAHIALWAALRGLRHKQQHSGRQSNCAVSASESARSRGSSCGRWRRSRRRRLEP